jgi:hypothetical protein
MGEGGVADAVCLHVVGRAGGYDSPGIDQDAPLPTGVADLRGYAALRRETLIVLAQRRGIDVIDFDVQLGACERDRVTEGVQDASRRWRRSRKSPYTRVAAVQPGQDSRSDPHR